MLNRREFMRGIGIVGAGVTVFPKAALSEMVKGAPNAQEKFMKQNEVAQEVIYSGYTGRPCMVSVGPWGNGTAKPDSYWK